ncbi:MAG: Fe-S cluster assembly protein SufD [Candidatus Dormibacteraeota bacterium]|nr:Fe-S cluster assembly protein SufD [Candidatus Dormibacteraeota bacterium]
MTLTAPGFGDTAPALDPEAAAARAATSPDWLAQRRRAAWDAYESTPFPSSQRDEDWRRTDISGLHLERFRPLEELQSATLAGVYEQWDRAEPNAAFALDAPGLAPVINDADALLAQGVIITTLEEAASLHPELVQRALASIAVDESKFIALWNAMWFGGIFVYVPPGVEALTPVWIAHPADGESCAVFPASVVMVEDSASLTIVDTFASPNGPEELFSDAVSLITAGRDAAVDYITLQQWGGRTWHVATHRATLDAGARLRFFGATLGARLQKAYWDVILAGTGAEADINGICFAEQDQHIDHQTLQAHRAAETRSNLLLKVAVRDTARSVYGGLIDVAPEAVHADGYVQNRNLLLTHGAKTDSVPRLEIKANDVRCGHGATAGHIDDDHRFYFTSRGVPREDADALIVRGFMEDVVRRVPHEGIANLISSLLDAEIAGRPQLGLAEVEE